MKKIILSSVGLIVTLIFLMVFGILAILFFRPNWIINPRNLDYVMNKTQVLKSWSWKEAEFDLAWREWNRRNARGHFKGLCLEYESAGLDYKSCFEKLSWNFELTYNWGKGLHSKTLEPIFVRSSKTILVPKETREPETKSPPPNIWRYWKILWSDVVPDIDVILDKIQITKGQKNFEFDFTLKKTPQHLLAKALKFTLTVTPDGLELAAPRKYPFPKKIDLMAPLYFYDVKLSAKVKEKEIPLHLSGALEVIGVDVYSKIKLPLKDDFTSVAFKKKILLNTSAEINMPDIKQTLSRMAKDPFRELPAPLNAMDGGINIKVNTIKGDHPETVMINSLGAIRMAGGKQVLNVDLTNEIPINLSTHEISEVIVGIDFHKVALQLPRLSKKSPPPQFLPDRRFKKGPYVKQTKEKPKINLSMHLEAIGKNAMSIRTNLLDELLRFNFDLKVHEGKLQKGFVSFLPIKTSLFRRPILVKHFKINFNYPTDPVLISQIEFPLPEYKITLDLEGPLQKPRYHFSSRPPLTQNDIYSVLLFGRPMNDLDQTDKTNAQKTNQILAQGILSLSVLYFLAGSRVEYVGYDPEAKKTEAQFGLDEKTSLSIGRDQEGVNSSGIRRSLGKGWYLDTTIHSPSSNSTSNQKNYGVILERVLAY